MYVFQTSARPGPAFQILMLMTLAHTSLPHMYTPHSFSPPPRIALVVIRATPSLYQLLVLPSYPCRSFNSN
ncbi:hypothetical protein C8R44DRAFT_824416 [Mycena epipterygia]|nr:hypothetical protein C8R44DRAFT_824416 [Mycena epipterygia]